MKGQDCGLLNIMTLKVKIDIKTARFDFNGKTLIIEADIITHNLDQLPTVRIYIDLNKLVDKTILDSLYNILGNIAFDELQKMQNQDEILHNIED